MVRCLLALFVTLSAIGAAPAGGTAVPERIEIPATGGLALRAFYYRPPGNGPFPALVALHGCGGLYDHQGALDARSADYGTRLAAVGYAVLFPDSFGSRGIREICTNRDRSVAMRYRIARAGDAAAAARWLQTQPGIAPNRISLMGWSNGAIAVMNAIDATHPVIANAPAYRSAVAFYPDCRRHANDGWRTHVPLLVLIGADDDWAGAPPCVSLEKKVKAAGDPFAIVVYPGAYHDFDWPAMTVHTRSSMGFTYSGDGIVHVGTNPAARDDAWLRITSFLAEN